jgi:predicted transcriptional regulator
VAVNREARETRNAAIVVAVLVGEPRREVAHLHGVNPRTLRRIMQCWHAGELSFDVALKAAAQLTVREIHADLRRTGEMIDRAGDGDLRSGLILRRIDLLVKQTELLAQIAGPEAVAWKHGLDPGSTHELNARVRDVLAEHGVAEEAIEAAADSVITWSTERTGHWGPLGVSGASP